MNKMSKIPNENEKSRSAGAKPDTSGEALNRRNVDGSAQDYDKGRHSVIPKNADVGDLKNDR
jgi:hypothetical protein